MISHSILIIGSECLSYLVTIQLRMERVGICVHLREMGTLRHMSELRRSIESL